MTIEERARQYVIKTLCNNGCLASNKTFDCCEEINLNIKTFIAGVEEATRWINAEEQMPEELKSVLTMAVYEGQKIYAVDFVKEGRFIRTPKPVKWRPIEFE